MNIPKDIQDKLDAMKNDLPAPHKAGDPFNVPEGYFEGFAASMLAKVRAEETQSAADEIAELSPLLAGISRQVPFSVPQGYFDTVLEDIPSLISDDRSAVLSLIEQKNPYTVPSGYFYNFPDSMLSKVSAPAKVVPMMRRKWARMAVAAALIGIIATAGLTMFGNRSGNTPSDAVAVELKKASTEELNDFITTTDASLSAGQSTASNSSDVNKLLQDVSDKELEAFLAAVPTDDDALEIN